MDNQSPLGDLLKKTVQFHGKLFSPQFLQATVGGPILGIDFPTKFKVTVAPETIQIFFACTAVAPFAPKSFLPILTAWCRRLCWLHPAPLHCPLHRQIAFIR
jgi:hypothetical protein